MYQYALAKLAKPKTTEDTTVCVPPEIFSQRTFYLMYATSGTMNFVISFALLLTMPIGGQMLDSLGSTALSGLYLAVVFMGGALVYAARSVMLGNWFDFKTAI